MIKKHCKTTINFSKEAVFCLQATGHIDKRKKVTKKNLSKFISRLIVEHISFTYPLDRRKIQEKVMVAELRNLQDKRDHLEEDMKWIAGKLNKIKEINKE